MAGVSRNQNYPSMSAPYYQYYLRACMDIFDTSSITEDTSESFPRQTKEKIKPSVALIILQAKWMCSASLLSFSGPASLLLDWSR